MKNSLVSITLDSNTKSRDLIGCIQYTKDMWVSLNGFPQWDAWNLFQYVNYEHEDENMWFSSNNVDE